MTQLSFATEWMPVARFDPAEMVATTTILGEAAAVVMLAGEPWMSVLEVGGVRRLVMWSKVEHRAALARVVAAAGELGLRVLPSKGLGGLRVARVPIVVTHRHYQGRGATAYRETLPAGVQLVSAGEQVRTRAVRAGLLVAVRLGRRAIAETQDAGRWL